MKEMWAKHKCWMPMHKVLDANVLLPLRWVASICLSHSAKCMSEEALSVCTPLPTGICSVLSSTWHVTFAKSPVSKRLMEGTQPPLMMAHHHAHTAVLHSTNHALYVLTTKKHSHWAYYRRHGLTP
ncbi:hypothetical protein DUNSADRAFT_1195 [Dunaliella salina]|uniref:Encoded protein n=1 Tax=Dunaliella salina TaxID=3046 RepID=A0ABQ7FXT9_DUNSA|nr:hypothetical protein DUNSADRAFT_1195 [Dunaliella salina]|eukprot:KAF5827175.1 hypothetical protein DUNSADRAFT_1195 [Dunaliella salina]